MNNSNLALAIAGRGKELVPYSNRSLGAELSRIDSAWIDFRNTRDRDAVYLYLDAVFQAVMLWKTCGWVKGQVRKALRFREGDPRLLIDTFAAVISCTSEEKKIDRRTRSKWSRALRYAEALKPQSESLKGFVKRVGGINACASAYTRFSRRRRKSARHLVRRPPQRRAGLKAG
jgi:hypothetical protein